MTEFPKHDLPSDFEQQWREWANADSDLNEAEVRKYLLERIPDRRLSRRSRLVLVAAAASLLAVFIGVRSSWKPPEREHLEGSIVHETGSNVVLVLREGKSPIYVLTDRTVDDGGKRP